MNKEYSEEPIHACHFFQSIFSVVSALAVSSAPQLSYNIANSQYIVRNRQLVESEPIMFVVNDGLQSTEQDHEELPGINSLYEKGEAREVRKEKQ